MPFFDCYDNFNTNRVGSLIPILILSIETVHSPIYQSNNENG